MELQACLGFLVIISAFRQVYGADKSDEKKVVCYFTNWSQYRPGEGSFRASQIEPFLCTHIIVAFGKLDGLGVTTLEWNDVATYEELQRLKTWNPALKTSLSVGGATTGSQPFIDICQSNVTVEAFSKNVVSFLRLHSFDGFDIDWEFPENSIYEFSTLLRTLHEEFADEALRSGRPRLMLSAALAPGIGVATSSYDVQTVSQYVDFASIMAYDYHGIWQRPMKTALHTALYPTVPSDTLSVDNTVQYYLDEGLAPSKMVLGMAVYGRGWTLQDTSKHSVGAAATGPTPPQQFSRAESIIAYFEICRGQWTYVVDQTQFGAYAYRDDLWVGYESTESAAVKTSYIMEMGLGGAMFWELGFDDFTDTCGEGTFPLINSVKDAFNAATSTSTTRVHGTTLVSTASTPRASSTTLFASSRSSTSPFVETTTQRKGETARSVSATAASNEPAASSQVYPSSETVPSAISPSTPRNGDGVNAGPYSPRPRVYNVSLLLCVAVALSYCTTM